MYHYVYRLDHIETSEFYVGSRSSKVHPSLDNYLGSMIRWKPDKTKLKKTIIKDDFETRQEAIDFEVLEITKVINDDLNRNYHIPPNKFCVSGTCSVIDKDGKSLNVSITDERYLNGELVGVRKNIIRTKDLNGNTVYTSPTDNRIQTGELTVWSKGMISVKDKDGNKFMINKSDPRYKSKELVGVHKGKLLVKDKEGNRYSVSKDDPRYLSGELVHWGTGLLRVKEVASGQTIYVTLNDPRINTGELTKCSRRKINNVENTD